MDITVTGRHTEVADGFRRHVSEKLARLERLDPKVHRLEVEICHERNRRQSDQRDRVEITCHSKGPVVRAEAAAADAYAALDLATSRLEERLRRAADRRHSRHAVATRNGLSRHRPGDLRTATGVAQAAVPDLEPDVADAGDLETEGGLLVREKVHAAVPMTVDEALHRMELVGHDFYLFADAATGVASVVYRRRGYSYGVLRLAPALAEAAPEPALAGGDAPRE